MRATLEQRGGAVLRDHMRDQHREFFAQQQQIYLSLLDHAGRPWATLLEGEVGFITSLHPRILAIAALPDADDPAGAGISNGAPIGVLGIEFATWRRNRLNGEILYAVGAKGFMVQVAQSFGKIQSRQLAAALTDTDQAYRPAAPQCSSSLLSTHVELIDKADTFFIASRSPAPGLARSEGLDMSHRGGLPGFVRVRKRTMFDVFRLSGKFLLQHAREPPARSAVWLAVRRFHYWCHTAAHWARKCSGWTSKPKNVARRGKSCCLRCRRRCFDGATLTVTFRFRKLRPPTRTLGKRQYPLASARHWLLLCHRRLSLCGTLSHKLARRMSVAGES